MNIRRALKASLLIATGLGGMVFLSHGIRTAHAQDGPQGRHHGRGGGLMRLCHGDMDAKLEKMTTRVETELDLNPTQKQNLDAIAQAIKTSDLASTCSEAADEAPPTSPVEKMDRMEARLETGLSTIQQIRQPVETFYESLSTEQQTELDALMSRRRRRH